MPSSYVVVEKLSLLDIQSVEMFRRLIQQQQQQQQPVEYERLINPTHCFNMTDAKRLQKPDAEHTKYIDDRLNWWFPAEISKQTNTKKALSKSLSAPVTSQYDLPAKQSTPRKHLRVMPSTYKVDRANKLEDMNIGTCVNEYRKNEKNGGDEAKEHFRIMKGCDVPIETPKGCSASDRMALCEKWYARRCGLHVYNTKELKKRLKLYLVLKCNIIDM